ncbi:porin [Cupriavidus necator]|uniref:Porin n=1 Tax=Cupriavidus necator TaxID=106590 RepID=A0A1U9UPG0_CUPNE|nr:porin [Cupriavidus necator]
MKTTKWLDVRTIAPATLAILLSGAACAQTSVTLYGVMDMNIEYVNNMSSTGATVPAGQAAHRVAMLSGGVGGSRWGLRGVEDLGRGLQAVFVLESGFTADDGKLANSGRLFGRQAFVGLDSDYGKLTFGRQYTSIFDVFANFQAAAYQPQYEPVVAFVGRFFREDNTVKYTGKFGPVSAVAHWSFGVDTASAATAGEVPGNFRSGSAWGGAASYVAGPFGLALGYDEVRPPAVAGAAPGKNQKASAAVKYSANDFQLMAGYRWGRNQNAADAQTLRDNYYWIGGTYTFTPALESTLAYYYDDVKQVTNPVNGAFLGNIKNPWQVLFVTKYALSKRTSFYLSTAYSKNASLNFDTSVGGLGTGYYLGAGKNSQFGAALGFRHLF